MRFFQANSDTLREVADLFQQQADDLRAALDRFSSQVEGMRGNSWIGLGADKFFDQYDTELLPAAEKTINNFESAADNVDRIAGVVDDGFSLVMARSKSPI